MLSEGTSRQPVDLCAKSRAAGRLSAYGTGQAGKSCRRLYFAVSALTGSSMSSLRITRLEALNVASLARRIYMKYDIIEP